MILENAFCQRPLHVFGEKCRPDLAERDKSIRITHWSSIRKRTQRLLKFALRPRKRLNAMPGGEYERRIVAFLDILGFSRLVENADDPKWREAIEDVVVTMRETLAPNEAADLRLTQFSDCIVISATLAHYGCNLVMTSAIMLANNLLGRMVLLRGGIAVGNLIHTDDVMFGPGLLVALRKDTSGAPPRISLDQSLVDEIGSWENDFGLESLIRDDEYDLTPMLHTLHDYAEYTPEPVAGKVVLDGPATLIAERLAWQCHEAGHEPAIRAKWLWMARYWDEAVGSKGILPPTKQFLTKSA